MNAPSPNIRKVLAFLDKSSGEDIYTAREVAVKAGIGSGYVKDNSTLIPEQYTHILGGKRYYGNPKAIAELRRQVGA